MVDFPQGIKDMTRRCGRASFTVELGNRLAIGPAAEAQAARQSNQRLLAIVHVSGYSEFESAAQRLSPTIAYLRWIPKPTFDRLLIFAGYS
jgi:hypothetical protein